jgi:putative spermidine/putrescine transport system substrate-binding protein
MELIALNMTAEIQAAYSRVIPYGPVNADAIRLLDAKTLASLPSIEPGYAKGRLLDLAFWADNGPQTVDRFNKWLLS